MSPGFGRLRSISLDGDVVAFGANSGKSANPDGPDTGLVTVYRLTGGSWHGGTTGRPAQPDAASDFGRAVEFLDGTLMVGTPTGPAGSQVYAFTAEGSDWTESGSSGPTRLPTAAPPRTSAGPSPPTVARRSSGPRRCRHRTTR